MESGINSEISDAVEIIKEAWSLYISRLMIFLPIGLCFAITNELSNYVISKYHLNPVGGMLLMNLMITSWLTILLLRISLNITENKKLEMKNLTKDLISIYPSFIAVTLCSAVLIVFGFICLVLPGIYLATILYFADVIVVKSEKLSLEAFRQSAMLVKGIFRRVLFCIILVVCLLIIPIFIAQGMEAKQPLISRSLIFMVTLLIIPFSSFVKVVLFKKMVELKESLVEE